MGSREVKRSRLAAWTALLVLLGAIAMPASGVVKSRERLGSRLLTHLSQSVAIRQWMEHPAQAPEQIRGRLRALRQAVAAPGGDVSQEAATADGVFNQDILGLPQNEESVTVCRSQSNVVLGGTNDYRGLVDPEQNFTGWHLSTDGGKTVRNEGRLPRVRFPSGAQVPSGGDPVVASDRACNLYGGSLNYDL